MNRPPLPVFLVVTAALSLSSAPRDAAAECFIRGDANVDGVVDISDPITVLLASFRSEASIVCDRAADANGDDIAADISDAIFLLSHIFLAAAPPPAPFPGCGVDPDSALSCAAYAPCEADGACPVAEMIDVAVDAFSAVVEPTLTLSDPAVVVGEPARIVLADLGVWGPGATIDWGDGSSTWVDADGPYEHAYASPGVFDVVVLDRAGGAHPGVAVEVGPPPRVASIGIRPAAHGAIQGVIDPITGQCGRFQVAPRWSPLLAENCHRVRDDRQPAPPGELLLTLDVASPGDFTVEVVADLPGGQRFTVDVLELHGEPGPVTVPLPSVPAGPPGRSRLVFEVTDHLGAGTSVFDWTYFVTAGPTGDPCDPIIDRYFAVLMLLAFVEDDCDDLRAEIARLEGEIAAARAEIADLQGQIAPLDAQRDALDSEADALEAEVRAGLAGVGELKESGDVGPDDQFVGTQGLGVVFTNAAALLARSDAHARGDGNGTSLLAKVGQLARLRARQAALDGRIAAFEARIAGLEADIAANEARIAELEALLAECEAAGAALEIELEVLIEEFDECLAFLAEIEKVKETIRDAEREADDVAKGAAEAAAGADEARDDLAGTPGSAGQHADDEEGLDSASDAAAAAAAKSADAKRLAAAARAAADAGDLEEARRLAAEAAACATRAKELLDGANEILDDTIRGARARECTPGEVRRRNRREFDVWTRILGYALSPHDITPEEWAGMLDRAGERLDAVLTFLSLVEAAGDASVIGGAFTPNADEVARLIVDRFAGFIGRVTGVDAWVLLEGHREFTETVCRCTESAVWVYTSERGRIGGTIRGRQLLGWIPLRDHEGIERELQRLVENHARGFVANR